MDKYFFSNIKCVTNRFFEISLEIRHKKTYCREGTSLFIY